MGLLKTTKRSLLATKGLGLFSIVSKSEWRRRRLLILCYHGISMREEQESHPEMFLPPATFARRMLVLKQSGACVLRLGEALRMLRDGTLPQRSVVITFDDGWADFRVNAYPVLQKYNFPATVYLTTYYCLYNRPIFRFAIAHMMWAQKNKIVDAHGRSWLPPRLDLSTAGSRVGLLAHIDNYAKLQHLSGRQKDELAAEFAAIIGFDYDSFAGQRLFQLMNPEEVAEMARGGIDIQLHTHRHRTPLDRHQFISEITRNRVLLGDMIGGGQYPAHFCYPSGAIRPAFLPWLREAGVQSATTCNIGLSTQSVDQLVLPRILDQVNFSDDEFESWVTGFAAFLPKRSEAALDVAPE